MHVFILSLVRLYEGIREHTRTLGIFLVVWAEVRVVKDPVAAEERARAPERGGGRAAERRRRDPVDRMGAREQAQRAQALRRHGCGWHWM